MFQDKLNRVLNANERRRTGTNDCCRSCIDLLSDRKNDPAGREDASTVSEPEWRSQADPI